MIQPQIYEGTAEEIAQQLRVSNLIGRFKAIVVPENGTGEDKSGDLEGTLAERLEGRVGRFDFGDANLSEDTGEKFADLLVEKRQQDSWFPSSSDSRS